jgi:acetyl-CoA acetyltransferase
MPCCDPLAPPAFSPQGTVTAANASSISDGARPARLCGLVHRLGVVTAIGLQRM